MKIITYKQATLLLLEIIIVIEIITCSRVSAQQSPVLKALLGTPCRDSVVYITEPCPDKVVHHAMITRTPDPLLRSFIFPQPALIQRRDTAGNVNLYVTQIMNARTGTEQEQHLMPVTLIKSRVKGVGLIIGGTSGMLAGGVCFVIAASRHYNLHTDNNATVLIYKGTIVTSASTHNNFPAIFRHQECLRQHWTWAGIGLMGIGAGLNIAGLIRAEVIVTPVGVAYVKKF